MEMSVADLGADLENDLADLYARIKALPRLKEAQDTLQHMESQRRQHAKRAAEISQRYALPGGVRFRGVIETQNRLEQAISDAVVQDPDPAAVYRRLADAKETLALLYRRIAEHVRSFGAVHAPIAEAFDQLAAEELMHRAAILTASETLPAG